MTGTVSHAPGPGGRRCSRLLRVVAFLCVLAQTGASPAVGSDGASPLGTVGPPHLDQFVDPDLYCEYQISKLTADPARETQMPVLKPQLLSLLPTITWQNIVRVHADCWVPGRSWSSLRHLLEGGYHDRLFGMISGSYLVKHLTRSAASSLSDPRVFQYLMDAWSSSPEKGQKVVPRKISEEIRLGIGAQLIARALSDAGGKELPADQLPALWKRFVPVLEPPDWTPERLTQLELLTNDALKTVVPFWRRSDSIVEGDSLLLQRYAFYRGPSSSIRPRPLTQPWDLLHLRSVPQACNELEAGGADRDRSKCPPSTLMWEKIAGQSRIQHTFMEARFARHNGIEGTQVTMDWLWDFNYVMFPFSLQVVRDTIKAYFRSLIRGFYTLPRE